MSSPMFSGAAEVAPQEVKSIEDEYDFVRMPDGSVHPVRKSAVHEAPETHSQNLPAATLVEVKEDEFYVHLANGDVRRVKESNLPTGGGSNAAHGFWQEDNKVHTVIGVYAAEVEI